MMPFERSTRARIACAIILAMVPATAGGQFAQASAVTNTGWVTTPVPPGAAPLSASRAPTSFFDRMQYYMNRGMLLGAAAGVVYGLAVEPRDFERRSEVMLDGMIGASAGMMTGALVGVFAPGPPPRLRDELPQIGPVATLEEMSKYVGLGGRLGAGAGAIRGALVSSGRERGVYMLWDALMGFGGGMVVGAGVYLVQAAR